MTQQSLTNALADRIAEDARLMILAELARQTDATLNALTLARVLDAGGLRRGAAWLELQLRFLNDLGAVQLRRMELSGFGEVSVASLRTAGRDHVERRSALPGVTAPADAG